MSHDLTWDGLEIAPERPRGSSVLVRRGARRGEPEHLLLHRSHNGPDYEGDWAWTQPAGARQPGEAVYPAALRELAEEAGITGAAPWPIDLSGDWAAFALDVPDDIQVDLVDPEHDRYAWATPQQTVTVVRPEPVSAQHGRLAKLPPAEVGFVPMSEDDFSDIVRWQHSPQAREWYAGSPVDVDEAARRYAKRLEPDAKTRMWIVEVDGHRVGYMQAYRVSSYDEYATKTGDPDAIGFDYVIGETDFVGGIGTRMVWCFMRDVIAVEFPDAPRFIASPDRRNLRSLRVLEKCGLEQGLWIDVPPQPGQPSTTEIVCTFDRAHWLGSEPGS